MADVVLLVYFVLLDFVVVGFEGDYFEPVGGTLLCPLLGGDELAKDGLLGGFPGKLLGGDLLGSLGSLVASALKLGYALLNGVERFELGQLLEKLGLGPCGTKTLESDVPGIGLRPTGGAEVGVDEVGSVGHAVLLLEIVDGDGKCVL